MASSLSLSGPLPAPTPINTASIPGFDAAPTPTTYATSPFRQIYREERMYHGVHIPAGWYSCCLHIVEKNGIITKCPVEGGYCPEVLFGTERNEKGDRGMKEGEERRGAGSGEGSLPNQEEIAGGVVVDLWTTEGVTGRPWEGVGVVESMSGGRNEVVGGAAERRGAGGSHEAHTHVGAAARRKAGYVLGGLIVLGSLAWISL